MEQTLEVNGARLWCRLTGEGDPILQIHGSGFGHRNFDPATPVLAKRRRVIDYDQRGYGRSERPAQRYDIEVWADDAVGLLDALGIERAHVHGSSMGGMVATLLAGKYPERVRSVVINCAAAKLGRTAQLLFKGWIDLVRLDPDGVRGRALAEATAWQALSRRFIETAEGERTIDVIQDVLSESNDDDIYVAACEAMIDLDLRDWLPRITAPALVIGGDEDIMTPWDQGPAGAGQDAIHQGIAGARKHVIAGSAHSSMLDSTDEYLAVVERFLEEH